MLKFSIKSVPRLRGYGHSFGIRKCARLINVCPAHRQAGAVDNVEAAQLIIYTSFPWSALIQLGWASQLRIGVLHHRLFSDLGHYFEVTEGH